MRAVRLSLEGGFPEPARGRLDFRRRRVSSVIWTLLTATETTLGNSRNYGFGVNRNEIGGFADSVIKLFRQD